MESKTLFYLMQKASENYFYNNCCGKPKFYMNTLTKKHLYNECIKKLKTFVRIDEVTTFNNIPIVIEDYLPDMVFYLKE